jgi:DNA-binding transcriptional MerR regulator
VRTIVQIDAEEDTVERWTTRSPDLRIGELAVLTGVSTRALRHYEHSGVLASERLPNGYRVYDPAAVDRVRRIRYLLGMGLPLDAIREVSDCLEEDLTEAAPCEGLVAVLGPHMEHLERRIAIATAHRRRAQSFLQRATGQGSSREAALSS